jgi:drug/metabolite transporter (DMT)-like permease
MTLAAAVLFAVSAVVAADVFDAVSPARVAQFRSLAAALVLGFVAFRRRAVSPRGQIGWLLLLGANLAAVTVTFYWAIERLGVGPGTTIQFTAPVLVMTWMRLVERRSIPPVAWLAGVAAVAGTGLMTRAWQADLDGVGVAAGVAAAVTFASYLILGERLGARLPSLTVISFGFAVSALIWLVAVPFEVADLAGGSGAAFSSSVWSELRRRSCSRSRLCGAPIRGRWVWWRQPSRWWERRSLGWRCPRS